MNKKTVIVILLLAVSAWCLPTLYDDIAVSTSITPSYYSLYITNYYWWVVGVRPSDWDIVLYNDTTFTQPICGSNDFVVCDAGHTPHPQPYGVKAYRLSGSGNATVEYENGSDMLTAGLNGPFTWAIGQSDVVEIWDVYLTPTNSGTFTLDITSGSADLGFALFKSNGVPYYATRSDAVASADANGSGGDENFSYAATSTEWYGLVVWANNTSSATYTIYVPPGVGISEPYIITHTPNIFAPNPFSTTTTIEYNLPKSSNIVMKVLDAYGGVVKVLTNSEQKVGFHRITWDGKNSSGHVAPAGIYFCKIEIEDRNAIQKMIKLN